MEKTFFERHGVMVLIFLLAITTMISIIVAEKVIYYKNGKPLAPEFHYLQWRLHTPQIDRWVMPGTGHMDLVDGALPGKVRLRTDSSGFIGPTHVNENPDLKLVFLGGSTTECLYLKEDNRFPYRTAQVMQNKYGYKVNAYNGGRSGNASIHSINNLFNVVTGLEPDVVVFMHNVNDIVTLIHSSSYWSQGSSRELVGKLKAQDLARYLKNKTVPNLYNETHYFVSKVRYQLNRYNQDEFSQTRDVVFNGSVEALNKQFEAKVRIFVNIAKQEGIRPVLMTQANRFVENPDEKVLEGIERLRSKGIDYRLWHRIYTSFNEVIKQVAAQENVQLVDLDLLIPKEPKYLYDAVHLSDEGSILVSEIVAKALHADYAESFSTL